MNPTTALRQRLLALGFDVVRFAKIPCANMTPHIDALRSWIAAGQHADMHWIGRGIEKRTEPSRILEEARSMIVLGINYFPAEGNASGAPFWARYALYSDYHDTIKTALENAGRVLEEDLSLTSADYRYYVDTGPVLERAWGERAGLGFVGKNAMLISRDFGNWLFLAAILVRAELAEDKPLATNARAGLLCGKCTRCIDACPTRAITRPGVVDARLCISYQTIENKGIIPRALRGAIGARIYGCDVCAEVCPWNRFAQASRSVLLDARPELSKLSLREILTLTPERFASIFRKTAIKRVKLPGLLRNACIVAGNTGNASADCLPQLAALTAHESAIVRAHAVWAVFEIAGRAHGAVLLRAARQTETNASVLDEYNAAGA